MSTRKPKLPIKFIIDNAVVWRQQDNDYTAVVEMADGEEDRKVLIRREHFQWLHPFEAQVLDFIFRAKWTSAGHGIKGDVLRAALRHQNGEKGKYVYTNNDMHTFATHVHAVYLQPEANRDTENVVDGVVALISGYQVANIGHDKEAVISTFNATKLLLSSEIMTLFYPKYEVLKPIMLALDLTPQDAAEYLEKTSNQQVHSHLGVHITIPDLSLAV